MIKIKSFTYNDRLTIVIYTILAIIKTEEEGVNEKTGKSFFC
jgi:hypothetical protein